MRITWGYPGDKHTGQRKGRARPKAQRWEQMEEVPVEGTRHEVVIQNKVRKVRQRVGKIM